MINFFFFSVTTVEICEDSSLLSAGFADSQVRIWTMSPNKLRGMKPSADLDLIDKEAGESQLCDLTAAHEKLSGCQNSESVSLPFP